MLKNIIKKFTRRFERKKFPLWLFLSFSISALILFPIFVFSLKSMTRTERKIGSSSLPSLEKISPTDYDMSDPFITKAPKLKDLIKKPIINDIDPSLGNKNASITIVEYSDFECQYCQKQEKIIKELLRAMPDKIRFIWKDYPETEESSASYRSALAARCAGKENKFWEMHDRLFEENKKNLTDIAKELKLNEKKFKSCLDNNETGALIQDNIQEANALNITGIPYIYVNDKEILGEISVEELKSMIELELKK